MNDDLGVAPRAKHVAERGQFRDQRLVVVDLAVVDDDDAPILVEKRLLPGGESMIESRRWPRPTPGSMCMPDFVGAAVMLRLVHVRQQFALDFAPAAGVEDAGNSAHLACLRISRWYGSRRCRTRNGSITGAMPDEGTV